TLLAMAMEVREAISFLKIGFRNLLNFGERLMIASKAPGWLLSNVEIFVSIFIFTIYCVEISGFNF
ncbi:MAG: hypothetical protein WBP01_04015, partial [Ferruginibacter sp.]